MSKRWILAACVLLCLSGCSGGGVKLSVGAVEVVSRMSGAASRTVELTGDDVSRLAKQAGVNGDAIRDAAPQLDTTPFWQRSLSSAREVYEDTPEDVREVLIGVACDGLNGKIRSEADLYDAVGGRVNGLRQGELEGLVAATLDLWQDLYDASNSNDPALRASAALACYTYEVVG